MRGGPPSMLSRGSHACTGMRYTMLSGGSQAVPDIVQPLQSLHKALPVQGVDAAAADLALQVPRLQGD